MTIQKELNTGTLTLAVTGRVDTVTAPDLEKEISAFIDGITKLVIDFQDVEYISSAGLRVLLSCHKKMMSKDGMTLKNVNETVNEIFEVTGFSDILDIE